MAKTHLHWHCRGAGGEGGGAIGALAIIFHFFVLFRCWCRGKCANAMDKPSPKANVLKGNGAKFFLCCRSSRRGRGRRWEIRENGRRNWKRIFYIYFDGKMRAQKQQKLDQQRDKQQNRMGQQLRDRDRERETDRERKPGQPQRHRRQQKTAIKPNRRKWKQK